MPPLAGAGKAARPAMPPPKRAAGPAGLSVLRSEGRVLPEGMLRAESLVGEVGLLALVLLAAKLARARQR